VPWPIDDGISELGVTVHGPDSAKLAPAALSLLQQWHRQRPAQPSITARRVPTAPATHIRAVASSLTVARWRPSELNATAPTTVVWVSS
jgi:hypothetical protein